MPIRLPPDAARCLPLLARSGADPRLGFPSVCARPPAVWLARRRIPRFARRPGSLSSAVGNRGSRSQAKSLSARGEGTDGSWEDCRLLAFELDGTRVPPDAPANLRSARPSLCPWRSPDVELAESQYRRHQEADTLRQANGAPARA